MISIAILLVFGIVSESTGVFQEANYKTTALLAEILRQYVIEGKVKYSTLKNDYRLEKYIEQISVTDPAELGSDSDKLAFWINTYNAYTLKIVCDNYPLESITDLSSGGFIVSHILGTTVWDKEWVTVNGELMSLNDVEHKIIRQRFKVPEIHFALVCASTSCPSLRNESFDGERLSYQLKEQAEQFLSDKSKNYFDVKNRIAYISKIFDWYESDFGSSKSDVLNYISQYLPTNIQNDITTNADKWQVEFKEYNWSLNESY